MTKKKRIEAVNADLAEGRVALPGGWTYYCGEISGGNLSAAFEPSVDAAETVVGFDPGKPFDVGASDDMVFVFVDKHEPTEAQQLGTADLHITMAGGHCGNTACTRCDPMERYVDGLTVRECLAAYQRLQQEDYTTHARFVPVGLGGVHLTPAQHSAARAAWSAQLKARVEQAEERERSSICVDDDRWEP